MKKKILLVDDKIEFRSILQIILESYYDVRSVSDGLEALAVLCAGYYPDLIISDLVMSNVDGITLVQQIKSSDIYKYIPVLIVSSNIELEKKLELIDYGVSDYIDKPFDYQELELRIKLLLNKTG